MALNSTLVNLTAPNLTKHPNGMAVVNVNGTPHQVNRYGVIFAPSTPDILDGYSVVNFADDTTSQTIRQIIRPALLRTEGCERIYSLRAMRTIFNSLS